MRFFDRLPSHPIITTRIFILVIMVAVLGALSLHTTEKLFPSNHPYSLVFQSGLLIAIFGSLILEDKFTKPADALVNASFVFFSLLPILSKPIDFPLAMLLCYTAVVFLAGLINLSLLSRHVNEGAPRFILECTSEISSTLGKSKMIHSFLFLYAVHAVNTSENSYSGLLLVFWAVHLAMWPFKLPHILDAIVFGKNTAIRKGTIIRVEFPNILKVKLERNAFWVGNLCASLGDGSTRRVLPLYTQLQEEYLVGTGLLGEEVRQENSVASAGTVYSLPNQKTDNEHPDSPIGIVCEGSRIASVRFETWNSDLLREGILVYVQLGGQKIYYQVSDALTKQEAFESNRHGFQVAEAHQLGTLYPSEGFKKYAWLPDVNCPVYKAEEKLQCEQIKPCLHEMALGTLPGTDIQIVCNIDDMISHHTAILGVTGSGKTELAFRMIERAICNGVKVFCVDITGDYINELSLLSPQELSIDENLAADLGQKLHDVETGTYGAPGEKRVLKEFTDDLRKDIDGRVERFMKAPGFLGVFTLRSISNTKATIQATEIYLTSLFKFARENTNNRRPILVVLEEAHTVIPEAHTMGLGDFDSKGMVAKIAQIALQGRKYEVGLLVIAQRTATVSKTVLTQCNTMIAFSSFDKTGLDFLSNVYGAEHTSKISNLLPFHALAFGKGIRSERPVVVEMPPLEKRVNESVTPNTTDESFTN